MPVAVDNFILRIFTPQGLVLEDYSSGVTLPAAEGEIGILPHHAKYVGMLGTGILEYETHPVSAIRRIAISGGICAFTRDSLTVLADRSAMQETAQVLDLDLNREELLSSVASGSLDDPERLRAQRDLAFIEAVEKLTAK